VGGTLAAAGGVCVFVAVKRIQSCHPLTNPAVEAFKENLKWSVNPK
jgi:putative component of membrane protein insertase Oxa1/YidC/SpoIIIJ protein YidD